MRKQRDDIPQDSFAAIGEGGHVCGRLLPTSTRLLKSGGGDEEMEAAVTVSPRYKVHCSFWDYLGGGQRRQTIRRAYQTRRIITKQSTQSLERDDSE